MKIAVALSSLFACTLALVTLFAASVVSGCWGGGAPRAPATDAEVQAAHGAACGAKGSALAATGQMYGQPCVTTLSQLRALLESDPDCRAFFGDAGAHVVAEELCESDAGE